jgi:serine/threonine-protein kinase
MTMTSRFGRYETLRAIASGGMATVYLGRALGAGGFERLVAIKVMHPHIADDPEFVAMFLDEARLAARVRHPNVVATIDVQQLTHAEAPGGSPQLFIVMEYIDGPSLQLVQKELRKDGRLMPLSLAVRIFLDALAGLHAAHELIDADGAPLNLIHRDVSPQNLIVGLDGITRITDFGVARAESRLSSTRGGQLKGKIAYMAPEQIRSEASDRRCDIYAAGVLLWELLVGQRLFKAENDGAMVAKILQGAPRSPRSLNPDIPPDIDAVCMRALRISPHERWPTAADFADALEDAATVSGVGVASPRAVTTYLRQLDLGSGVVIEPPSRSRPSSGGSGSRRMPPSSLTPLATGPSSPDAASAISGPQRTGSTQVGAVVSYVTPRRPRRGLYVVGATMVLASGAALFYAGRMAGRFDLHRSESEIERAPAGRADAPTPEAASSAAAPTEPTVAASASPQPSASSSARAAARPANAPAAGPRPNSGPRPAPKPSTPASPTSFRPNDL